MQNSSQRPPQEVIDYWASNDLPAELMDAMREIGWSDTDLESLLSVFRSHTTEDIQAFKPENLIEIARYNALTRAGQALALLEEAIRVRTDLNLEVRNLTTEEQQVLQLYRHEIDTRQADEDYGGDFLSITETYAAECVRLALLTNNFTQVEEHLNLAYGAAINASGAPSAIVGFRAALASLPSSELSMSLRTQLYELADSVEEEIAAGLWSQIGSRLKTLRSALSSASATDIEEASKKRLLRLVESLESVNGTESGVPAGTIEGTTKQVGTFVGGMLTLELDNPLVNGQWGFAGQSGLVPNMELRLDGVPIAQVLSADAQHLELMLLADATPEHVEDLLRSLRLILPTGTTSWLSGLEATLSNGVGGTHFAHSEVSDTNAGNLSLFNVADRTIPKPIAPIGTLKNTTPTFQWQQAQDATWYRLYVQNDMTNQVVIDQWVEGATTYTHDQALPEGNYQFWVQGWGNGKYGNWSDAMTFSIDRNSVNNAPWVSVVEEQRAFQNETIEVPLLAVDQDGDELQYTATVARWYAWPDSNGSWDDSSREIFRYSTGHFEHTKADRWTEFRTEGPSSFYEEVLRNEQQIVLYDADRDMYIRLTDTLGTWRYAKNDDTVGTTEFVEGNRLRITPAADFLGLLSVVVTVFDGATTTRTAFEARIEKLASSAS